MNTYYLKSKCIFLENEIIDGLIKIENGIIVDIIENGSVVEADIPIVDYSDYLLAPGYFDTHVHGFGGHDVMDCTEEAVLHISTGIVPNGVTSFLPTTLTDTTEKLAKACEVVKNAKDKCTGAKVQGIFLEGPFFTEEYKGAQNPAYMKAPDFETLEIWQNKSGNLVNKIAIAPEHENSLEFIKKAVKNGVNVALGHSNATYEQAVDAVRYGANIFVHTYNGMSGLHHRNPGMVGAALTTEAFCELICDGHHVHQGAIKVVTNAKGKDKTVLVTDCMSAGGMPEGNYKLGEFDVTVKDGTARLKSGSLAGSVLTLQQAVKNMIEWKIATPLEAISMASIAPAKSVGVDKRIGSIAVGKCADFNILNDKYDVVAVYIDGVKKYDRV